MMEKAKKMMDKTVRTLGFEHEETIKVAAAYDVYYRTMETGSSLIQKREAYRALREEYLRAMAVYCLEMEEEE